METLIKLVKEEGIAKMIMKDSIELDSYILFLEERIYYLEAKTLRSRYLNNINITGRELYLYKLRYYKATDIFWDNEFRSKYLRLKSLKRRLK